MCRKLVRPLYRKAVCTLTIICGLHSAATPLVPLFTPSYTPLGRGVTTQIWLDWNSEWPLANSLPDRTYRKIWVRLFPQLSTPLGDPYTETQNLNDLTLSHPRGLKVHNLTTGQLLYSATSLTFDFDLGVVTVNKAGSVGLDPLWVVPVGSEASTLVWDKGARLPNGKSTETRVKVRGGFVVKRSMHEPRDVPVPNPRELWSVINVVGVNEYLQSVVPSEVIASWHPETLKAQAIAARTYGLYEVALSRLKGLDFDVDPTTWYQSYQGVEFWNRDTNAWRTVELKVTSDAVKATGGEVILFGAEVIKAFFSSNSGGRTCLVNECFEEPVNPPYIREVDDHPSVKTAPGGTWGTRANLTAAAIKEQLKKFGLELPGTVSRLEALEKGPSGRTWRLRVILTNGTNVDLDRYLTRKVMHLYGPIRSFMYELGAVGSDGKQKISGHGYGHAVGMSQWGAQLFARQGWNAHRILQHYYQNCVVQSLTTGNLD